MSEYQEIAIILFENKEKLSDNDYLKLCNLLTKIKNKNNNENNQNNENDKIIKNILFSLEIFIIVILLLII